MVALLGSIGSGIGAAASTVGSGVGTLAKGAMSGFGEGIGLTKGGEAMSGWAGVAQQLGKMYGEKQAISPILSMGKEWKKKKLQDEGGWEDIGGWH